MSESDKTMVERVRTAIAQELDREGEPFYRLEAAARAAVSAMREPTEGMMRDRVIRHHGYAGDIDLVWRAMIDAALGEGQ